VPCGTRAPKELLHHPPALELRRPSVSAGPTVLLSGVRGSRLLDLRPPHYRCPAVPGPKTSARAILMMPGSSVRPSGIDHLPTAVLLSCVLLVMRTAQRPFVAPLSGSQPRLPAYAYTGWNPTAEPPGARARSRRLHRGTAHSTSLLDPANCSVACDSATSSAASPVSLPTPTRVGTPLPNLPVRASAADAFTEVLPLNFTAATCTCGTATCGPAWWRPLITAGHPVRSSVPSPSCNCPGSGTPPPHRPAYCTCGSCCPAVRICQALLSSWLREKP